MLCGEVLGLLQVSWQISCPQICGVGGKAWKIPEDWKLVASGIKFPEVFAKDWAKRGGDRVL